MTIEVHPAAADGIEVQPPVADATVRAERASVHICLLAPRAKREHLFG